MGRPVIACPTRKSQVRWREYADVTSNSGVSHYATFRQAIAVMFRDGKAYLYTSKRPGKIHVEEMRRSAEEGQGLSRYIVGLTKSMGRKNYDCELED
jgi:hypothetical protein